jgi:hypothetical protein
MTPPVPDMQYIDRFLLYGEEDPINVGRVAVKQMRTSKRKIVFSRASG